MAQKQTWRFRDWTAGQIDASALRREDTEVQRSGARVFRNMRPLGTGAGKTRPGRRAILSLAGRTEPIRLAGDESYRLNFIEDHVRVYDEDGAELYDWSGYPWTDDTLADIRIQVIGDDVVICYPGMCPLVIQSSRTAAWAIVDFEFQETLSGKLLAPFYRFARPGIQMRVSALSGSIDVEFNRDVLVPEHVGAVFRYSGRQLIITAVTDPQNGTADTLERLPPTVKLDVGNAEGFEKGQIVAGTDSGAEGLVVDVDEMSNEVWVIVSKNYATTFSTTDKLVGPNGRTSISLVAVVDPRLTPEWDEILMSEARGWPRSVSQGFGRLFFSDFEGAADVWAASRISVYDDFLVGAETTDPFTETVPGRARVTDIVAGSDIFVFTDRKIYYVPVSEANPLRPGSVAFRPVGRDGAARIRPVETADGVIYVNAGLSRIMALVGTGQSARPYILQDLTAYHNDVILTPITLAATTGDGTIPERFIYCLNSNGTLAVGRVDIERKMIGWQPWDGQGFITWVAADGIEVLACVEYNGRHVVEVMDDTVYLDSHVFYNAAPDALEPLPGLGPLWFLAGEIVTVMDGLRDLGERLTDPDGFLVPVDPDDDLSSATLVCGFAWTVEVQPFVPHAGEGPAAKQGMRKRRIADAAVTVQNSTGYTFGGREVGSYVWGDNMEEEPPLRSSTQRFMPRGWSHDPQISLTKTRPGPLTLLEITLEVTV
jgi:hypothetical protein